LAHVHVAGIAVGWEWSYTTPEASGTSDSLIAYNHLYRIGQGVTSDLGCIYTLGVSPGTEIHHNLCHDVDSFNYGGWGLYLDQASSNISMHDNIVHDTKCAPFMQHWGQNNSIANNIFVAKSDSRKYCAHDGALRSQPYENNCGTAGKWCRISDEFRNNIAYVESGDLFSHYSYANNTPGWDDPYQHLVFDGNVYYGSTNASIATPPQQYRFPGSRNWTEWQAAGQDVHGAVADPLFVDLPGRDFRLRAGSPALAAGFVPIDLSGIGPRVVR
jgi:hypothetical protein